MNIKSLIYAFTAAFLFSLVTGCAESPESRAAKDAREHTKEAFEVLRDYKLDKGYDYEQARDIVDRAVRRAGAAGGNADAAYFASGDLTKAYASKSSAALSSEQESLAESFRNAAALVVRIGDYKSRIETVKMLMESGSQEAAELAEMLEENQSNMKSRLAAAKEQLQALQQRLDGYEAEAAEAANIARGISSNAEGFLRESRLLQGEQRIELERKAYAMLKGTEDSKNSIFYYNSVSQDNLDLAEAVRVEMQTIEPLVDKLENDIERVSVRIDELQQQDSRLDYSGHIRLLQQSYNQDKSRLEDAISQLSDKLQAYKEQMNHQIELYEQAKQDYQKVRSAGLLEYATLKIADCNSKIASLNAQSFAFVNRLAANAANISAFDADDATEVLTAFASTLSELADEFKQKTELAFEKAFESYENLLERYRTGGFADVSARNFMSAIYSRMGFDKMTSKAEQTKDELLAKVEEIKNISIEHDPEFAHSRIASMFADYGIEFKSEEQLLQEEYLDLRMDFADAQRTTGRMRYERLISLLEQFNRLDMPQDSSFYDNQVNYIYGLFEEDWIAMYEEQPDMQELEIFDRFLAAVAEPEPDESETFDPTDPNSPF